MVIVSGKKLRNSLVNIINDAEKMFIIVSPYIIIKNLEEWQSIIKTLREKSKKGLFLEIHTKSKYYDFKEKKCNNNKG